MEYFAMETPSLFHLHRKDYFKGKEMREKKGHEKTLSV